MTGTIRNLCLVALGLTALVQAGCIAALAGAAGAGAVAGYAYYNGLLYRDYRATLPDSLAAVRSVLANQKFTIDRETADVGSASVQTKTSDGYTIRVHLDVVASPVPGDGPVTRIGIRVGFSGDETVSARILDGVSQVLPGMTGLPGAPPVAGFTPAPAPAAASTAAPPLATSSTIVPTTTGAGDPDRLVPIPAGIPVIPRP